MKRCKYNTILFTLGIPRKILYIIENACDNLSTSKPMLEMFLVPKVGA